MGVRWTSKQRFVLLLGVYTVHTFFAIVFCEKEPITIICDKFINSLYLEEALDQHADDMIQLSANSDSYNPSLRA